MRIAFVIPSLGAGGAERVASLLANDWSANGHEVTLVTFDAPGTEPFFALHPGIAQRALEAPAEPHGLIGKIGTNAARVSRLRSVLRERNPDAVVAFMTEANVIALWASQGLGVPVVVSERNQPDRPGLGTVHRLARRLAYPKARPSSCRPTLLLHGRGRASTFRSTSFPIRFASIQALPAASRAMSSG